MSLKGIRLGLILLGLWVIFIALAPPLQAEQGRPNIVLIVVDDLRFDEFGAGGHPYLETPHIDRLASEGAMFHNAYHATRRIMVQHRYVWWHGGIRHPHRHPFDRLNRV